MFVVRKLTNMFPQAVRFEARRLLYSGAAVTCPLCGHSSRRYINHGGGAHILESRCVVGGMQREADRCPVCHGCDRTRMMMLFLEEVEHVGERPVRLLHVAPDLGLYLWLRRRGDIAYFGSDLDPRRYAHIDNMHTADLTKLPFVDGSFDVVICSHVLEHVPDDRTAMKEIARVLDDGGKALLLSPFARDGSGTDEDPTVRDPSERLKRFGQWDHVRIYDIDDFEGRMIEAGLDVFRFRPFETHPTRANELHLNPFEALPIGIKSSRVPMASGPAMSVDVT